MKPKSRTNQFVITTAFAFALAQASLSAIESTWVGASGAGQNWQTATNWSTNPSIPTNAGDTATFANTLTANTTVLLNGAVTIGRLVNLDTNNEINIQNGTGGSITFDTGTAAVPTIEISRTGGVGLLLYATINGSSGLSITGSTTTIIRLNSANTDWAGFSGGLSVTQGVLAPQAGNYNYTTNAVTANKVLPTDERLTLGATGTTDFNLASGRDVAVGSLAGNSNSYVYNSSTGASFAVLAVGNDNSSGAAFGGTIGNNSGGTAGSNILHLHKIGSGTQEVSGKITGLGNVVVVNGTLNLSNSANNNDFTGTTTVNSGATLKIGSANALGATGTGSATTLNAGTLDLNGQTTGETLNIATNGTLSNTSGTAASLTADANVTGNFTVNATGDITATRLIGTGAIRTITKLGKGTLTTNGSSHNNLSSWNIQAGKVVLANTSGFGADRGVVLNGGILQLSGSNSNLINNNQDFTVNSGTFDLNGKSETVASIGGSGGTIRNSLTASTSTLTVGVGDTNASYAGVIENGAGTLKLTKEGSGIQTLNGTNTYTGATTITGGTLAIGTGGSIDDTSAVVINGGNFNVSAVSGFAIGSSQTLTGSGGSVTGDIIVDGTLAIGSSPGTMTFNNDLTLGSGSFSNFEFTTGTFTLASYDLGLGGDGVQQANFGGTLNLLFDSGETYANGSSVTIFDFESYSGNFATLNFSGLGAGQSATFDALTGTVSVVPEPRAALLGGLGLLALLRRRRA